MGGNAGGIAPLEGLGMGGGPPAPAPGSDGIRGEGGGIEGTAGGRPAMGGNGGVRAGGAMLGARWGIEGIEGICGGLAAADARGANTERPWAWRYARMASLSR